MKNGTDCGDIKHMIDEFRKASREDITLLVKSQEFEKQRAQTNDLTTTKKRLLEVQESKEDLAREVQKLKEQLNRIECTSSNQFPPPPQPTTTTSSMASSSSTSTSTSGTCSSMMGNNYQKSHSMSLEKEIEHLKAELNRNKPSTTTTIAHEMLATPHFAHNNSDVLRTIEKYERQKDYLSEHNQALKILLKEKELNELQMKSEIKALRERYESVEMSIGKLKSDLDIAMAKVHEANMESERYALSYHTVEEQLNLSEKKRDELKTEAQETIKL